MRVPVPCALKGTLISRVRIGTTLTVACPKDRERLLDGWTSPSVKKLVDQAIRSPQSVVVNQSLRVEKNYFYDEVGWAHHDSQGTMIWEILDVRMNELDVVISLNGKMVGMHDTMWDTGIGHDCTLRCTGSLRGGAQRFRQPDIPGQWTCSAFCVLSRTGVASQKSLLQVWVPEGP